MTVTTATAIRYYDVVIIGGGIAGIAIAEFLARKHPVSIKVVEHAPQLGTGEHPANSKGGFMDVCQRFDTSYGLPPSTYDILKSADVSLNAATIMRDLVASALANDVEFDTGVTIDNLVLDRLGMTRVNSLLCRGRRRLPMHLKAKLFVFAVGAGFDHYLQEVQLRVRLKVSHSAMVVAWPALCPVNFARKSINPKFHFNHLVQRSVGTQGPIQFSMLANSGFWDQDAQVADKVADIDAIIEAAERYFGREELYGRKLYAYECAKTEFLSEEEEKRRYSYWIEHPPDTNYLGVLPGKFSFFPTVAYQTYLRMKALLHLDATVNRSPSRPDPKSVELANKLVADAYPVQILSAEIDHQPKLSTEACEDLSVIPSASRTPFLAEKHAPTGS
jgi:hypothetical protein